MPRFVTRCLSKEMLFPSQLLLKAGHWLIALTKNSSLLPPLSFIIIILFLEETSYQNHWKLHRNEAKNFYLAMFFSPCILEFDSNQCNGRDIFLIATELRKANFTRLRSCSKELVGSGGFMGVLSNILSHPVYKLTDF